MEDAVMERSYDYPAKNTVREEWMRFLPSDLSHPNDYGLYLPGSENLELDGYLRRGMLITRLLGAEHDSSVMPQVIANSGGIRLIRGSLLDAIHHCEWYDLPRLRFANLDFDGNQHTFLEEILALARIFPSVRGSYLGVTSYAARDRGALVQGVVNACKFYSGLPASSAFSQQYGRMLRRYEHLLRLIPNSEASAHAHVQRELGLLWWIVLMLAVIDPLEGSRQSVFDQRFIDQLDEMLGELSHQVETELADGNGTERVVFLANRGLRDVLAARRVSWWVNDLRRLAYWSLNRQPMRTWYFRIVPLAPRQQETAQSLLEQLWTLASRAPLVYVDSDGEQVVIQTRSEKEER
jgi:hypothetical protein